MRKASLLFTLVAGVAVGAAGVAFIGGTRPAEAQSPAGGGGPRAGAFTLQLRGATQSLNDTVRNTLLRYDPGRTWALVIIGARGKGQFTCELRSTDRAFMVALQRSILESKELSVNCSNGLPSALGGVSIDLDDPSSGSFVLGAGR
jgi:hypothetical protein